jgi:hypothetical protein
LTHVKVSDVEFDFGEKLDEAEKTLPPSKPNERHEVAPRAQTSAGSSLPPDYTILKEWRRVEDRLQALAAAQGLAQERQTGAPIISNALGLHADKRALINKLQNIRNAAVHHAGTTPTRTDALRYGDLVDTALTWLPEPDTKAA